MRFIPVQFSLRYPTIGQPDFRHAFQLPPAAFAVKLGQPLALPQRLPCGDHFNVGERANDFDLH
jgi:hypothetical protein